MNNYLVFYLYIIFFRLLPLAVTTAALVPPSHTIPNIFALSHQPCACPPSLHPWTLSVLLLFFLPTLQPVSSLLMSKLSQPWSSYFVSKALNVSFPSDILVYPVHCGHTLSTSSPACRLFFFFCFPNYRSQCHLWTSWQTETAKCHLSTCPSSLHEGAQSRSLM